MAATTPTATYPESGFGGAFHPTSHHSGKEEKIVELRQAEHVSRQPDAVLARAAEERLPTATGTLLDNTVLLYGSAMGDSNQHNHKRVPFFIAGTAGGALQGRAAISKPRTARRWPNVMLSVLHALGMDDVKEFGDSEAVFDLKN